MTVICAWCKRPLREIEPAVSLEISHGICLDCLAIHFSGGSDVQCGLLQTDQ